MRTIIIAGFVCIATANISFFDSNSQARTLKQGVQNVTYPNASIPYAGANMDCENCVRGGYDFCLFRTFPDNTTHKDFTNCTEWAIIPEINSVSTVEERDRYICAGAFKDRQQALTSMCALSIDYTRDVDQCGPYVIDLSQPAQVYV